MDFTDYLSDWEDGMCDNHPALATPCKNLPDTRDHWIYDTVKNEVEQGALMREKKSKHFSSPEYRVIDVDNKSSKMKNRLTSRKNNQLFSTKNTSVNPSLVYLNPIHKVFCKRKIKARCPLRIEELALPTKRLCLDTWRHKSHLLPAVMILRLKQLVLDERPTVKLSDAIQYFKARKQKQKNISCKKIIVNKVKNGFWDLNLLGGVLGYRIMCKLMKPLDLIIAPDLQPLCDVINIEISKLLSKTNKNGKTIKNKKLQKEISKTITMWTTQVLQDAELRLLLDDLNDLEEKDGHIFDLIDDLMESTLNLCCRIRLTSESEQENSLIEIDVNEKTHDNESDKLEINILSNGHKTDNIHKIIDEDTEMVPLVENKDYSSTKENIDEIEKHNDFEANDQNNTESLDENSGVADTQKKNDELKENIESALIDFKNFETDNDLSKAASLNHEMDNKNGAKVNINGNIYVDETIKNVPFEKNDDDYNYLPNQPGQHQNQVENKGEETRHTENEGELKDGGKTTNTAPVATLSKNQLSIDKENMNSEKNIELPNDQVVKTRHAENEGELKDVEKTTNTASVASLSNNQLSINKENINSDENIGFYKDQVQGIDTFENEIKNQSEPEAADDDVSDVFKIHDEPSKSESKNVTFRSSTLIARKFSVRPDENEPKSEIEWLRERLTNNQKPTHNSSSYSINQDNFAPPNLNLLDPADEKWPDDVSDSRINLVQSISRSVISLGHLKEEEEYLQKKQSDGSVISEEKPIVIDFALNEIKEFNTKAEYLNEWHIEDSNITENLPSVIDLKLGDETTQDENVNEAQNRGSKITEPLVLELTHGFITEGINKTNSDVELQLCQTKRNAESKDDNANIQDTIYKADDIMEKDKHHLTHEGSDKTENTTKELRKHEVHELYPNTKLESGYKIDSNKADVMKQTINVLKPKYTFDYKVNPETAPSWVLKAIGLRKVNQDNGFQWCNTLEETAHKLSQWNNWLLNTCDSLLLLNQAKCVKSDVKAKSWEKFSNNINKNRTNWLSFSQLQIEKLTENKESNTKQNKNCNCRKNMDKKK